MKENDYCRCCLSEDCEKDMKNEYFFEGTIEVYSRMLAETFDINLSQNTESKCLICNGCVSRLRDAAVFKKQVLATEQNILKLATLDVNIVPKTELKTEDDDFDDRVSVCSDSDFGCGSKTKDKDGHIFFIKIDDNNKKEESLITKETITKTDDTMVLTKTRSQGTKVKAKQQNVKAKNKERLPRPYKTSQYDVDRRNNTLKLLQNSNMCLFISHRIKYGCYACKKTFLDITALRAHTATHPNTKSVALRISQLRGSSYKNADISDLKCKNCNKNCTDLIDLKDHLISEHKIEFANQEHLLIPYRLKNEFRCVMCDEKFKTFTRLSIHMNTHYTNNVCHVCGSSFINPMSLRLHYASLHKEKKCKICGAVFLKLSNKKSHMRKAHDIRKHYKRHCNLCDQTFQYSHLLDEHRIKEHNFEKPPTVQCQECDKVFLAELNLRTHMRSVHKKERNHPCEVCGMRFFTKTDRVRHERTHDDVKRFSCSYCDVKFKCKDSSRRHMKRQHGHTLQS